MKTKTISLLVLLIGLIVNTGQAQNDVEIEIIHKLNGADFEFGEEASTPEAVAFELERMEYYISEISIEHDGGTVTEFEDVWVLVQADASSTIIDLGNDSIESVESVTFSIGVDSAHNHLDPTIYSTSHPLGPKSPSMHWGWTAGYRFVAMEGDAGDDLNQTFEIHALGDQNYFETTTDVTAAASGGSISIPIYANYAEALRGIDVEDGVITHGDFAEAIDLLENFQEFVFSSVEPVDSVPEDSTTSISKLQIQDALFVDRNPSVNGTVTVSFDLNLVDSKSICLIDITGKKIESSELSRDRISFNGLQAGVYVVYATAINGESITAQKVVVLE
ncbi:MAG: hypothetical protein KC456_13805 [Flavobacteriales bacterium]|nr:hypothetical protein [Flavobacteriales bacterium]